MTIYYLILSFHLIAIITWISALFLIQRTVLLQADGIREKLFNEGFYIYKKVANPAFLFTIVFGITLISLNKVLLETGFWIYLKFFFVSLIIIIHHLCKINLKQIKNSQLTLSIKNIGYHSFAPIVFIALILILTITKPF